MQSQIDAKPHSDADNVPQARRDGAQQRKAREQQDGLQLLETAAEAVRAVGGGGGAEEVLEMHNGRGVVLLWLVLLAGQSAALGVWGRGARLVWRG